VNFPACAAGRVKGVAAVAQGTYDLQSTEIIQRKDVRQRAYYWIGLRHRKSSVARDSDLGAVKAGKISVTPLHLNLTETAVLKKMKAALG
jgi:5'-nucleotidase